jgi:DNA-binding transcriptional MerR regulator
MGVTTREPIPDCQFFRIGEVARILGVAPSAIRYWQREFQTHIHPVKTRSGQHVFSRRDVAIIAHVRSFVHDDNLSIREAREHLRTCLEQQGGEPTMPTVDQGELDLLGPSSPVDTESMARLAARVDFLETALADETRRQARREAHWHALLERLRRQVAEALESINPR